jgi:hypothetical protein
MRGSFADIRRLAAKGLSGKEAGRLAVAHLRAVERGQMGLLSKTDIEGLRACLRNASEEADYQRMLGLHAAARLMISEAQVASLLTAMWLEDAVHELERYLASAPSDEHVSGGAFSPDAALVGRLEGLLVSASRPASALLAFAQVLAEMGDIVRVSYLSGILGLVPFELAALLSEEGEEELLDWVRAAARRYDELAAVIFDGEQEAEGLTAPLFALEDLEPAENALAILRERIALGGAWPGLGANWWMAASTA